MVSFIHSGQFRLWIGLSQETYMKRLREAVPLCAGSLMIETSEDSGRGVNDPRSDQLSQRPHGLLPDPANRRSQ